MRAEEEKIGPLAAPDEYAEMKMNAANCQLTFAPLLFETFPLFPFFFISASNSNYGKLNHSENWNLTVMRVLYCVKLNPRRGAQRRGAWAGKGRGEGARMLLLCISAAGHYPPPPYSTFITTYLFERIETILKLIFLILHQQQWADNFFV